MASADDLRVPVCELRVPGRWPTFRSPANLTGRDAHCRELDQLVAAVVDGQSRALVLRGEHGIGKSALLAYLAAHAADCRVERASLVMRPQAARSSVSCHEGSQPVNFEEPVMAGAAAARVGRAVRADLSQAASHASGGRHRS